MLKMLGDMAVDPKSKKKQEEEKKAEEERKKAEAQKQYERDFLEPITALDQVFRVDSKAIVNRVCGEVVWLNNLATKTKDGSKDCVYGKISDGSMRNPQPVTFIGFTLSTLPVRTGDVVDIRGSLAMVRGDGVDLEVTFNVGSVEKAGESLAEHIRSLKKEHEDARARGGVPIEELIEEARAKLKSSELTPVTRERFLAWKEAKLKAKRDAEEAALKEAQAKYAKGGNVLSGKQLFQYDPTLFKDDEEAEGKLQVQEQTWSSDEEEEPEEGGAGEDGDGDDEEGAGKQGAALADEDDVDLDELEDD